ncbi:hypothetical protein THAOC_16708 [Thalassiosira oceanica]|uniref:Uncharacterized protein n=1 Tax=Thalassiosira oceanica TaxID=159749 RepID=K0SP03_THAOC|nr:hypothetical protein THAOC_16708 [Thalassiosira oceanica]|eukprot:EJK62671.1 hypothetical protein THAOC_16708 [Thalassiosira oceanica]
MMPLALLMREDFWAKDFCMSTDSHMDLEPDWDEKMVNMWYEAQNEYAVLSTYVANIKQLGQDGSNSVHGVPHLCMVTFTSQVRTHATKSALILANPSLRMILRSWFEFSKCHAELKVQVNPHTPGVFDGEEFN